MILLASTTAADLTTTAATWAFTTTSELTTEYFTTEYTTTTTSTTTDDEESTGWPFPIIKLIIAIPLAILAGIVGFFIFAALVQLAAAIAALFGITCACTSAICCCCKETIEYQVEISNSRNIPLENTTVPDVVVEDSSNNQTKAVSSESEPGKKYKTDAVYWDPEEDEEVFWAKRDIN